MGWERGRGVYHFSPPYSLPRTILDPSGEGQVHLMIRSWPRTRPVCVLRRSRTATVSNRDKRSEFARLKGDCFAKAHISTAQETPRQDARVSLAHEVRRRPESSCGSPQEGTPSPYARVNKGRNIRVARALCAKRISTLFTATGSAVRVPTSPCS